MNSACGFLVEGRFAALKLIQIDKFPEKDVDNSCERPPIFLASTESEFCNNKFNSNKQNLFEATMDIEHAQ